MGKVSGTSISIEPIVTIATISVSLITSTYHSTEKQIVIFYSNGSNSSRGTAICLQPYFSNLTSENYIGISDGLYSNGQLATIQVAGAVDDAQINLTAGKKYFVNANGVLKTTASVIPVVAGTAVSNTKIIIKG